MLKSSPFAKIVRISQHTAMLLLAVCPLSAGAETVFQGQVSRVWDGDSVHVIDSAGQRHKIRLAYIDAPEIQQADGIACRNWLRSWLLGQNVRVRIHDIDRYQRAVAQLSLANGNDVGQIILKHGCAWHYRHYAQRQQVAYHFLAYQAAEQQAKQAHLGLWHNRRAIAPWRFRHTAATRSSSDSAAP